MEHTSNSKAPHAADEQGVSHAGHSLAQHLRDEQMQDYMVYSCAVAGCCRDETAGVVSQPEYSR